MSVVLIGGSRLKGYGDEHSDVDVTICMRPGADESRRTELLDKVMPLLGGEKPHEFWLEEAGQGLAIRLLYLGCHGVVFLRQRLGRTRRRSRGRDAIGSGL